MEKLNITQLNVPVHESVLNTENKATNIPKHKETVRARVLVSYLTCEHKT